MRQDLIASGSIIINTSPSKIWKALTDPEIIKEYLFGTNTVTDWKVGSVISFEGEYEGHKYRDHGIILEFIPDVKLSYTYWSGFTGLEDMPENYSIVTCSILEKENNTCEFTWSMQGFANEDGYNHSKSGMDKFLGQIKGIVER